jgi:RHS repeat-associated protein
VERTPADGGGWRETTIHAATDHLSSVRILTDINGNALPNHIYYPFGKELTTSGDTERIKWAGYERDLWNTTSTADDSDYLHARHYNPQIGRFLQIDPLRGSIGRPQSLNRYAYVLGSPIGLVDPLGLASKQCPEGCECDPQGNMISCPIFYDEITSTATGWVAPNLTTKTVINAVRCNYSFGVCYGSNPVVGGDPNQNDNRGGGGGNPNGGGGDNDGGGGDNNVNCKNTNDPTYRYIASWNAPDSNLNEILGNVGGEGLVEVAKWEAWAVAGGVGDMALIEVGAALQATLNPYLADAEAWGSPSARALFQPGSVLNSGGRWRIGYSGSNFSLRGSWVDWFTNGRGVHVDIVKGIKVLKQSCPK